MLDAARRALADGDTTLPFNLIAKNAEVGVGTVYRHFPTRQRLLEDLAEPSLEQLIDRVQLAASNPDPMAGLQQMLRDGLRCLLKDLALVAILDSPHFDGPQTLALGAKLGAATVNLLIRAQSAELVRADLEGDDLRRILIGMYHAVRSGHDDEEDASDLYIEIAVKGLGPAKPVVPDQ